MEVNLDQPDSNAPCCPSPNYSVICLNAFLPYSLFVYFLTPFLTLFFFSCQLIYSPTHSLYIPLTKVPRGTWTEFRTVLTASTKSSFTTLKAVTLPSSSNNIFVNTLTDFSNYPCFYDSKHPRGYASSGR